MSDFDLHRIKEKLKDLEHEQQQLNFTVIQTRRSEQRDLENIRRRFNGVVRRIEARQIEITREQKNYDRQLERLEREGRESKSEEEYSERESKRKKRGR